MDEPPLPSPSWVSQEVSPARPKEPAQAQLHQDDVANPGHAVLDAEVQEVVAPRVRGRKLHHPKPLNHSPKIPESPNTKPTVWQTKNGDRTLGM